MACRTLKGRSENQCKNWWFNIKKNLKQFPLYHISIPVFYRRNKYFSSNKYVLKDDVNKIPAGSSVCTEEQLCKVLGNRFFKFNSQTHITYFDRLKNIIVSSSSNIMRAVSLLENLNSNKGWWVQEDAIRVWVEGPCGIFFFNSFKKLTLAGISS